MRVMLVRANGSTPCGTSTALCIADCPCARRDDSRIKCDVDGNIWAGCGRSGTPGVDAAALDGVMVFNPRGLPIVHIRLPERCADLCFGGVDK